jgi:DNA gyrase subunit A
LISLIEDKKSKNSYSFSDSQVLAILELRLQKLTALGINEIEVEIKKLADLIKSYKKRIQLFRWIFNFFTPLSICIERA